jgi:hypothetical protein
MTISEKMDKMLVNQARHDEKIDAVIRDQEKLSVIVLGAPGKPGGLIMDVDRIKRSVKIACWFIGVITIASTTVVGKVIYASISTGINAWTGATP